MLALLVAAMAAEDSELLEDRLERGNVPVYGQVLHRPELSFETEEALEIVEPEVEALWSLAEPDEPEIEAVTEAIWAPTPALEPDSEAPVVAEPLEASAVVLAPAPTMTPLKAKKMGTASVDSWPVPALVGSALASACVPVAGCAAVTGLAMIVTSPQRPPGMSDRAYEAYRDAYKAEVRRRRLMMSVAGGLGGSVVGVILWREFY